MIDQMKVNQINKKEIFSEFRNFIYLKDTYNHINEVKISFLKTKSEKSLNRSEWYSIKSR